MDIWLNKCENLGRSTAQTHFTAETSFWVYRSHKVGLYMTLPVFNIVSFLQNCSLRFLIYLFLDFTPECLTQSMMMSQYFWSCLNFCKRTHKLHTLCTVFKIEQKQCCHLMLCASHGWKTSVFPSQIPSKCKLHTSKLLLTYIPELRTFSTKHKVKSLLLNLLYILHKSL